MKKEIKSKILSKYPNIQHGTSTKASGLSFARDNESNKLIIDQAKILKYFNLPKKHLIISCGQEHSDNIYIAKEKSSEKMTRIANTDALITNQKFTHLLIYTADCMPIMIFDPLQKVIAIVHSGWKGTVKKIVLKTLKKMQQEFGSKAKDIKVYIGPSIGPCCYDTQNTEQIKQFKKYSNCVIKRDKKTFIDLWSAVEQDLLKFGILSKNLENAKMCTSCQNKLFSSHHLEQNKRTTTNLSTIALI